MNKIFTLNNLKQQIKKEKVKIRKLFTATVFLI